MSTATLLAFTAGASAAGAGWELVGLARRAGPARRVRLLAAPLLAAGEVGRDPTARERRRLGASFGLVGLAAGSLVAGPWVGLGVAVGGPWGLGVVLRARRRRWRRALTAGAPQIARSLADGLSGGSSIRGAIAEAARAGGSGPEVDAELRGAAAALAIGEPTETVLVRLRDRAAAPGWETIVAAVLLQRDAGGDLAGLLRTLAADLEAAGRAEADARAVTAQARFTARLVCALPLGGAVLAELGSPGIVRETASGPLGLSLCGAARALQCVALLAVHRLARMDPAG